MGLNTIGFITDQNFQDEKTVKDFFGNKYNFSENIDGEEALSTKFDDCMDILSNDKGSLVLLSIEHYDLLLSEGLYIQFIIGDTSDTYCYTHFVDGELQRKLILSEGEIVENEGQGFINGDFKDEDYDFSDVIFQKIDDILGINDIFDSAFQRYK